MVFEDGQKSVNFPRFSSISGTSNWQRRNIPSWRENSYYYSSKTTNQLGTATVISGNGKLLWKIHAQSCNLICTTQQIETQWKWMETEEKTAKTASSISHGIGSLQPRTAIKTWFWCFICGNQRHMTDGTERPITYASRLLNKTIHRWNKKHWALCDSGGSRTLISISGKWRIDLLWASSNPSIATILRNP